MTDRWLKREVRDAMDIRENFPIGMVAPDAEGVDLDGVAFKLSDYENKALRRLLGRLVRPLPVPVPVRAVARG